eukprot:4823392-Prymnesium_polylepis.1
MDPQQRLVLEHSLGAAHGIGLSKVELMGSGVGVFVGVWASEYMEVLRVSPGSLRLLRHGLLRRSGRQPQRHACAAI